MSDRLHSISQTIDGGFILGGISNSNLSGDKIENCLGSYDYWIVKTDSIGSIQWQNTIGGNGLDALTAIRQTADGGYIIGGWSISNISGDKSETCLGSEDYWVVKTDAMGNIQWENTIMGAYIDDLTSIFQITDGGYILGGSSYSNISGDKTENSLGGGDF
ncbi:MAG: T9SS C-terminal target domain-containing protein, partial [Bacteroidetes bacterium]|nr:T9SS C-terminal target domain-containing protein [Bacteroidota bacterium]